MGDTYRLSVADLLNFDDPMFDFSHSVEHDNLFWVLGPTAQPSTVWTPMVGADVPAGMWQWQHQMVHDNMANDFGVQPSLRMMSEPVGSPWWMWVNYSEHLALNGAALASSRNPTSGG